MWGALYEQGSILFRHSVMEESEGNDFSLCLSVFPITADSEREGMCLEVIFTMRLFPGVFTHTLYYGIDGFG